MVVAFDVEPLPPNKNMYKRLLFALVETVKSEVFEGRAKRPHFYHLILYLNEKWLINYDTDVHIFRGCELYTKFETEFERKKREEKQRIRKLNLKFSYETGANKWKLRILYQLRWIVCHEIHRIYKTI